MSDYTKINRNNIKAESIQWISSADNNYTHYFAARVRDRSGNFPPVGVDGLPPGRLTASAASPEYKTLTSYSDNYSTMVEHANLAPLDRTMSPDFTVIKEINRQVPNLLPVPQSHIAAPRMPTLTALPDRNDPVMRIANPVVNPLYRTEPQVTSWINADPVVQSTHFAMDRASRNPAIFPPAFVSQVTNQRSSPSSSSSSRTVVPVQIQLPNWRSRNNYIPFAPAQLADFPPPPLLQGSSIPEARRYNDASMAYTLLQMQADTNPGSSAAGIDFYNAFSSNVTTKEQKVAAVRNLVGTLEQNQDNSTAGSILAHHLQSGGGMARSVYDIRVARDERQRRRL